MPLNRIQRPAIAQPQGYADIDWSNPLCDGLTVVVLAPSPLELTRNGLANVVPTTIATPFGVARSATGTQQAFKVADAPEQRSTLVTTFALLRRTSSVDPNYDAIGKNFQSNGAPSYVSDSIAYNPGGAGDNVIRVNQGVSGAIINSGNYTHPDSTKWHTVGGTYGNGFATLYVDGVQRSSVSAGAVVYGSSGDNSFLHNFGGKTGGFDVAIALRWSRVLSAAEMAAIDANPWQIFRETLLVGRAAAAGGTTVSPAKGSLVFGGKVPTISQTVTTTIAPAKGSLVFGGKVPTVARTANKAVAPTVGHLAFTGYVPTIAQNASQTVSPAKGALTFTGYAPALAQTITVTIAPAKGSLVFGGKVPTVARTANQAVAPSTGHLAFAGYAPTIYQSAAGSVQPSTGHLAFTGYAPTLARTDNRTVAPSTGHLNFGGHVPTVTPNGTPGTTLDTILKILTNRQVLDAATGKFTIYDDDSTTVLFQANAWADTAGTVPYSGGALRRIDRLT